MDGQGNLERTWKIREKSGNFEVDDKWQPCFDQIQLTVNTYFGFILSSTTIQLSVYLF